MIPPLYPDWFDPTADEPDEDDEQETYAAWHCRLMDETGGWNP